MLLKTHLAITLFFSLILLNHVDEKIAFIIIALIFTAVPDIDSTKSKLGRKTFPLSWLIQKIFGHRGFFHSLWIPLIFIILHLIFKFPNWLTYGAVLGYTSHLIADFFTNSSVYLFYPFQFKIKGPIKTSSIIEYTIFLIFSFVDIYLIVRMFLV